MRWLKRILGAFLLITVPPALIPVSWLSAQEPQWEAAEVQKKPLKRRELSEPRFDGAYVILSSGKYVYIEEHPARICQCRQVKKDEAECLCPADVMPAIQLSEFKGFYIRPNPNTDWRRWAKDAVTLFVRPVAGTVQKDGREYVVLYYSGPGKPGRSLLMVSEKEFFCGAETMGVHCELRDHEGVMARVKEFIGDRPAVFDPNFWPLQMFNKKCMILVYP